MKYMNNKDNAENQHEKLADENKRLSKRLCDNARRDEADSETERYCADINKEAAQGA